MRLHLALASFAAVAAALSLSASPAKANTSARCALDRSPFLYATAMPEHLRAVYDEDGNGLDDDIEQQIAECFVPAFMFDSAENAARNLGVKCQPRDLHQPTNFQGAQCEEPHPIFTMVPVSAGPQASGQIAALKIKWTFLYAYDGGTPETTWFGSNDDHIGDSESGSMQVKIIKGGTHWFASLAAADVDIGAGELQPNHQCPPSVSGVSFHGTHPIVYVAAGKHHQYMQPHTTCVWESSSLSVDYVDWVRGDHPANPVIPTRVDHAPLFFPGTNYNGVILPSPTSYPAVGADGNFLNASALARGQSVPATRRLRAVALDDLGYGESLLNPVQFLEGGISPIWRLLTVDNANYQDPDGDGQSSLFDTCPWAPGGVDEDDAPSGSGDGLAGSCDPEPHFQDIYLAGGEPGSPIARSSYGVHWSWNTPRGGFMDTDLDGLPDGEDVCPRTKGTGWQGNANAWAERAFFPPTSYPTNGRRGIFHRGDMCDPNPVAVPAFKAVPETVEGGSGCVEGQWTWFMDERTSGSDVVEIINTATRGVSINGPSPLLALEDETMDVEAQTFRCACRAKGGYTPNGYVAPGTPMDDLTECLDNPMSECYRMDFAVAGPGAQGHGWVPVYRPDCTPWSCPPYTLQVTEGGYADVALTWDWLRELSDLPPSHPNAHFDDDDFNFDQSNGYTDFSAASTVDDYGKPSFVSTYKYVLWTQTYVNGAMGKSWMPSPGSLPDPEALDGDLLDPWDPKSMALRSGFSPEAKTLRAQRTTVEQAVAPPCPEVPVEELFPELREPFFQKPGCFGGIDGPLGTLDGVGGVRVGGWGPWAPFAGGKVFRPGLKNAATIYPVWLDETTDWLLYAPGAGAIVRAPEGADPFGFGESAGEPDMLWVEKGSLTPRWARLAAIFAGESEVYYGVIASGTLEAPASYLAEMVQDHYGETAALVDPDYGTVTAYDPALGDWVKSGSWLPSLLWRNGAAMKLTGSTLVVAGGYSWVEGVSTNAVAIDVFKAEESVIAEGLPARWDASLVMAAGATSEILFVGGYDLDSYAGVVDDVWSVAMPETAQPSFYQVAQQAVLAPPGEAELVVPESGYMLNEAPPVVLHTGAGLLSMEVTPEATRIAPSIRTTMGWSALQGFALP